MATGAASAGSGALKAFGNYQSQQAAADAANKSAVEQYKYQLKIRENNWARERNLYRTKIDQYNKQVRENNSAAGRAYSAEQRRLNETFNQAAFQNQAQLISLAQRQGTTRATMLSGRTADRAAALDLAALGRNQAIMAENLIGARQAMTYNTDEIRNQLKGANRRAYSTVAIQPQPGVAPLPPTLRAGPSQTGLFADLAGAAASGLSAYSGLQAPPGFTNPPGGGGGSSLGIDYSPFNLNSTDPFNTIPIYDSKF